MELPFCQVTWQLIFSQDFWHCFVISGHFLISQKNFKRQQRKTQIGRGPSVNSSCKIHSSGWVSPSSQNKKKPSCLSIYFSQFSLNLSLPFYFGASKRPFFGPIFAFLEVFQKTKEKRNTQRWLVHSDSSVANFRKGEHSSHLHRKRTYFSAWATLVACFHSVFLDHSSWLPQLYYCCWYFLESLGEFQETKGDTCKVDGFPQSLPVAKLTAKAPTPHLQINELSFSFDTSRSWF